MVSHDLKSPVHNLQGLLQLMEKGKVKDKEKMFTSFRGQLAKMEGLIASILSYSRAGHEQVEQTEINLYELVTNLAHSLNKADNFEIEIDRNLPVLLSEEIFLYQIYSNLLSNAVKYNDKKEGKIKVGTGLTDDGDPFYYVEDNGPGIPAGKREKVFKMFAVLHQKPSSTGIGLAIIRKIIYEKGGRIWAEDTSSWNSGIKFCFTWPAEILQ